MTGLDLRRRLSRAVAMFKADSLFRNAVYLMASTAIMAVLGIVFWLFVARLYSPAQIGIASALISASLLISNISMLGLNSGLVRFLPTSKTQSRDINAAMAAVGGLALVVAAGYLVVTDWLGSAVPVFGMHSWSWPIFMALMAAVALNTLTDSVFIANRRAEYHLIVYAAFGLTKLVLPLMLVPFGSLGIFMAYSAAAIVSLGLSLYFMRRVAGYRVMQTPRWQLLTQIRQYMATNYVAVLLAGLPSQVMPLLIIEHIGAANAGYFSMALTMANMLYIIPSSVAQSQLAESSHNVGAQQHHSRHAMRLLALILVPGIVLAVLVAPYFLHIFGSSYAANSTGVFQILALTTVFVACNSVANTVLNVRKRSAAIIWTQVIIVLVTLVATKLLIGFGLLGVGWAIMLGYAAGSLAYLVIFLREGWSRPIADGEAEAILVPTDRLA